MKKLFNLILLTLCTASIPFFSFSQYILNGSATQNSCNCYTLTQPVFTQSGSVWNSNKISLNNSFDFHFNVYLGCQDADGADGIVFILQPISTSIGSTGEGMGFAGITPSIGITLDTWQNTNLFDPIYDHISIQANGYIAHDGSSNNLTPAVQASATNQNIEDCQWHVLHITWDAASHLLTAYFDDVLRVEIQKNLVTDIFNNDPMVYWGFSGATGGANNLQQFCTALNPTFATNFSSNSTCLGTPIIFTDQSESFTVIQSFYWDFGDGSTSTLQNPPPHYYTVPGSYLVKHVITGMDGCVSDTTEKTIDIGAKPIADFDIYDTCFKKPLRVIDHSTCSFGPITEWNWLLDGSPFSSSPQPVLPVVSVGAHQLKLVVISNYGCVSDTAVKNFQVKPIPQIGFTVTGGCVNLPIQFSSQQNDNLTSIQQWNWIFGDGNLSNQQNPTHSYTNTGSYPVQLFAWATNGCSSDTLLQTISIEAIPLAAFEVQDTCEGSSPYVVNNSTISFGTIAQWNWALDGQPLSNNQLPSFGSLSAGNHQLQLVATGSSGCVSNTAIHNFIIRNRPVVTGSASDGCFRQPIQFNANQLDNLTTLQEWNWNFNDGQTSSQEDPSHTYSAGGTYNIVLRATASNGCISAPVQFPLKINQLRVNAGKDTIAILNVPFQIKATVFSSVNSLLNYTWSPATGLNDPTLLRPVASLQNDITYMVTVTSPEGCVAKDTISITVFKGTAIYVPRGFTPNNDGLNDRLKPMYIGITSLDYFIIYNRWGEIVFRTTDMNKGWDGFYKGKLENTGSFVWIISAKDYSGKVFQLKGLTTIIK